MKYVLVAEDDDLNFFVIEALLLLENFLVFRAKNGEEAVHYFKTQNNISLVLMDIQMPVMDGLTATEEIRKINKNIPIVIQTAFALDKVKEKAFESGCTDFITKPLSAEKLIPKVQEYVCKSRRKFPPRYARANGRKLNRVLLPIPEDALRFAGAKLFTCRMRMCSLLPDSPGEKTPVPVYGLTGWERTAGIK